MSSNPIPTGKAGMIRETFRHAAIYSGASALGRVISFFMLPFYAHILRDIGYGVIGMIEASTTLLSSLLAYSFHTAVMRIYHEEKDPERKPRVASTATILVAVIVLPIAAVAALASKPISHLLLGTSEYWHLICLALASFWLAMISQTAQAVLIIQRRSATYSLIGLMRLIVGVGLNVWFVVIMRWDLLGFFLSGMLVTLLTATVAVIVQIRICGLGFDREHARSLMAFQLPLIPGAIARFFSRQVERVVVRFQIDLSALGVLEMAYKFPSLISLLVVGPFMRSWNTQRLAIADEPGAPQRMARVITYYLFLVTLASLVMAVNIRTVLQILTPAEFWDAAHVARIEILQVIVRAMGLQLLFGLIYAKRTGLMARVTIVISIVKVALSWVMISLWGLYGAAWSGFITSSVSTVWGYHLSQRYYRMRLEWGKVLIILGYAAALFVVIDLIPHEVIADYGAPLLVRGDSMLAGLQDSWLGTWKDGKVLVILGERGDLVLDLCARTLLVGAFLVILPVVHVETRARLERKLDGWLKR